MLNIYNTQFFECKYEGKSVSKLQIVT